MTREEFIEACSKTYAVAKPIAILYAGDRTEFDDEDFIKAFRFREIYDSNPHYHDGKIGTMEGYTSKKFTVYNSHGG